MLTPTEALAAAPLRSRWYIGGHHCTVVEVGLTRDGEPAVRLRRDGDRKPMPHRTFVSTLLKRGSGHGVPDEATTRSKTTARKEQKMARKAPGPKETEARAQREAKAKETAQKPSNGKTNGKAAESVPPVEDVTGKEPKGEESPTGDDLAKALIAQIKSEVSGVSVVKTKSYRRLALGKKTVAVLKLTKRGALHVDVAPRPFTVFEPKAEGDLAVVVAASKKTAAALAEK